MGMIMPLTNCGYCEHGNPPDSKYCNACGATLTLAPCPRCGAVLEITATTCYQCNGSKQESSKDALVPEADRAHSRAELALKNDLRIDKLESALVLKKVNEKSELPSLNEKRKLLNLKDLTKLAKLISFKTELTPRRLSPAAIVGTVGIAIVAFIGYYAYRHYSLDSPPSSSAANSEVKVRSGAAQSPANPGSAATASVPATATPTSVVSPCTERVAALGLCTPGAVPKREAEAVPVPAAVARPQTSNSGEPCAVAVAALGLCTPQSK